MEMLTAPQPSPGLSVGGWTASRCCAYDLLGTRETKHPLRSLFKFKGAFFFFNYY